MNPLRKELLEGKFLIVGHGETYNSKVVEGTQLFETWANYAYGSVETAAESGIEEDIETLNDEDQWSHSQDYKFTMFSQDFGETDHIEIYRITE